MKKRQNGAPITQTDFEVKNSIFGCDFTQPPWERHYIQNNHVIKGNADVICHLRAIEEEEGNANIIEIAPDMFNLLIEIRNEFEKSDAHTGMNIKSYSKKIESLISKKNSTLVNKKNK